MVDHPNLAFNHLASVEQLLCARYRPYCHNLCYMEALAPFHFNLINYLFWFENPIVTKPRRPNALHDWTWPYNPITRLHEVQME